MGVSQPVLRSGRELFQYANQLAASAAVISSAEPVSSASRKASPSCSVERCACVVSFNVDIRIWLKQVGGAIKDIAVSSVSTAMSNETAFAKASTLLTGDLEQFRSGLEEISDPVPNAVNTVGIDIAERVGDSLQRRGDILRRASRCILRFRQTWRRRMFLNL